MVGSFGGKVFLVSSRRIFTFDGLSRTASVKTEEQDSSQGKPATYIKGASLEKISLQILLSAELGVDVSREIEEFIALASAMQPGKLILGGAPVGQYQWLLTEVSVQYQTIDAGGKVREASLKLNLQEFVRPGVKKQDGGTSLAGGVSGGGSGGIAVSNPYKIGDPSAQEKAELKRPGSVGRLENAAARGG